MLKVGLTGGYASGKSFVANHLESLGCSLIYADKLGHQVLAPGGEAYEQVFALFGTVERKKLAAIVFSSPERLQQLNAIVHPAVFRLEEQALIGFESQNPDAIAVIEAAILIETGRYKTLDGLIVTSCRPEIQIVRAIERDHITREEAETRLSRQLPDAERVRFANWVIDTNGTPAETLQQTEAVYRQLSSFRNQAI